MERISNHFASSLRNDKTPSKNGQKSASKGNNNNNTPSPYPQRTPQSLNNTKRRQTISHIGSQSLKKQARNDKFDSRVSLNHILQKQLQPANSYAIFSDQPQQCNPERNGVKEQRQKLVGFDALRSQQQGTQPNSTAVRNPIFEKNSNLFSDLPRKNSILTPGINQNNLFFNKDKCSSQNFFVSQQLPQSERENNTVKDQLTSSSRLYQLKMLELKKFQDQQQIPYSEKTNGLITQVLPRGRSMGDSFNEGNTQLDRSLEVKNQQKIYKRSILLGRQPSLKDWRAKYKSQQQANDSEDKLNKHLSSLEYIKNLKKRLEESVFQDIPEKKKQSTKTLENIKESTENKEKEQDFTIENNSQHQSQEQQQFQLSQGFLFNFDSEVKAKLLDYQSSIEQQNGNKTKEINQKDPKYNSNSSQSENVKGQISDSGQKQKIDYQDDFVEKRQSVAQDRICGNSMLDKGFIEDQERLSQDSSVEINQESALLQNMTQFGENKMKDSQTQPSNSMKNIFDSQDISPIQGRRKWGKNQNSRESVTGFLGESSINEIKMNKNNPDLTALDISTVTDQEEDCKEKYVNRDKQSDNKTEMELKDFLQKAGYFTQEAKKLVIDALMAGLQKKEDTLIASVTNILNSKDKTMKNDDQIEEKVENNVSRSRGMQRRRSSSSSFKSCKSHESPILNPLDLQKIHFEKLKKEAEALFQLCGENDSEKETCCKIITEILAELFGKKTVQDSIKISGTKKSRISKAIKQGAAIKTLIVSSPVSDTLSNKEPNQKPNTKKYQGRKRSKPQRSESLRSDHSNSNTNKPNRILNSSISSNNTDQEDLDEGNLTVQSNNVENQDVENKKKPIPTKTKKTQVKQGNKKLKK